MFTNKNKTFKEKCIYLTRIYREGSEVLHTVHNYGILYTIAEEIDNKLKSSLKVHLKLYIVFVNKKKQLRLVDLDDYVYL